MNFFQHLVSFGATMLSLQDPHRDRYEPPSVVSETKDSRGYVVEQTLRASNHHDATRHVTTVSGRAVVATHVKAKTWKIKAEK